jgi:hypothetical protein
MTTSFALAPVRFASASISNFRSTGTRSRTTGLAPGRGLLRRDGLNSTPNSSARMPTATSFRLASRRAVSRTSALFSEKGIRTRMPFFCDLLALKVLAAYHPRSLVVESRATAS